MSTNTRLQQLFDDEGQSPWLDDLKRSYLLSGECMIGCRTCGSPS